MSYDGKLLDLHAPEACILKGVILPLIVVLLNRSFNFWLFSTLDIQVY